MPHSRSLTMTRLPVRRLTVLVTWVSLGGGCSQASTVDAALTGRVDSLTRALTALEGRVEIMSLLDDGEGVAYLTPGNDGYSVVRMDLGQITVQLENVQPYANGTQVTLRIGNPLSATIQRLSMSLEWGSLLADGSPDNANARDKSVTFSEDLPAGSWSRLRVVLEGTPPDAFGFVRIRDVGHGGLRLRS